MIQEHEALEGHQPPEHTVEALELVVQLEAKAGDTLAQQLQQRLCPIRPDAVEVLAEGGST